MQQLRDAASSRGKDSIDQQETIALSRKELSRGKIFAERYEVIEELGKGGMGSVYRVFDRKVQEEVALKLLKSVIAGDKSIIDRFRNELKLARKISHRNVCRMYDLGEEEGSHFITMEYVRGEDLKHSIARMGPLSIGKAISIAKQVCHGLAEAHRSGVIHRDLKPQNIMIDRKGNSRIMDFGIASSVKTRGITGYDAIIGTPEYMSPEQVEGRETDQRSDIYSMGIILYEMLTGKLPFQGDTPLSVAMKHKTEQAPDPREINAQIPSELSEVILKCLEKQKEERFQKADELISVLDKIEQELPTTEKIIPLAKPEKEKIGQALRKNVLLYGVLLIIVISLIMIGFYFFRERPVAIDSIAVLPLKNVSGNPEQEYFADGMTEVLITELAKMSGLKRVISSTSVMHFKETDKVLPEIARELHVEAIVEGSVMLVGEIVRINVQLIEAAKDRHLWADSYERNLRDVLSLQKEVAQTIAEKIKITITPDEQKRLKTTRQINPEAYEAYIKGRYHWNKRNREGMLKCIELFQKAIESDPAYALAYAGLADAYIVLGWWDVYPPKEVFPKAKAAALKALEIDDNLAEAHTALAAIQAPFEFDWVAAERGFKRAIELNPNYATAHQWYAEYLASLGRHEEAMEEIQRARELDPLSLIIQSAEAVFLYLDRQYDLAIEQCQKVLEMDPTYLAAHLFLVWSYEAKGMQDEALSETIEVARLWGFDEQIVEELQNAYSREGMKAVHHAFIEISEKEISQGKYVAAYEIALQYAMIGDKDKAFEWLDKAYEERSGRMSYLFVEPQFDSIRSDPRFTELLKKIGFEEKEEKRQEEAK